MAVIWHEGKGLQRVWTKRGLLTLGKVLKGGGGAGREEKDPDSNLKASDSIAGLGAESKAGVQSPNAQTMP